MLLAIANLQATYYQLWPWGYTPLVILRVAARYNFFSNGKNKQIDIFARFFDKILEKNAEEPSKPTSRQFWKPLSSWRGMGVLQLYHWLAGRKANG